MLALANNVPDVAEDEEIAGNGAGQTAGIVGVSGHKTAGKAPGEMRGRAVFGGRLVDAAQQILRQRDVLGVGEIDEAFSQARIVCVQRGLDLTADDSLAVSQGRIDLDVGQLRRVVLRCQHGTGFTRERPHDGKRGTACRHCYQSPTHPPPFHQNACPPLCSET